MKFTEMGSTASRLVTTVGVLMQKGMISEYASHDFWILMCAKTDLKPCWSLTSNLCTFGLMAWNLSTCNEQCKAFYVKNKKRTNLKEALISDKSLHHPSSSYPCAKSCLQLFGDFFGENSAEHVSPRAEDRTWSSNIDHFHKMPSWN